MFVKKNPDRKKKDECLEHRIRTIGNNNENSIHAFGQFEEEGNMGHFQYQFRFINIALDALYALGTTKKQG